MVNKIYYIIVFNSKNHAFFLESILKRMGYKIELFQAPNYLSKNCNMAIKINEDVLETVVKKIKIEGLDFYRIYKHYIKDNKQVYEIILKKLD